MRSAGLGRRRAQDYRAACTDDCTDITVEVFGTSGKAFDVRASIAADSVAYLTLYCIDATASPPTFFPAVRQVPYSCNPYG